MSETYGVMSRINCLVCTNKAQQSILNISHDLSPRERQLIILMSANSDNYHQDIDEHSTYYKAYKNLIKKVDLESLVSRGYLNYRDSDSALTLSDKMPVYEDPFFDEQASLLKFVSGNF